MTDTSPDTALVGQFVAPSAERAKSATALEELIASFPPPASHEIDAAGVVETAPSVEKIVEEVKTDPPAETVVEPPPGEAATLAKFVEREVALSRERESLQKLREEVERRMTDLEARQQNTAGMDVDALRADPWSVMQKAGLDPDLEVQKRLAAKLGAKAPPELRQAIKDAERDKEIRSMREDLARRDAEAANRAFYQQVHDGAFGYVRGDIKNAPNLAKMAKEDANAAHAEIMDEIVRDANTRKGNDPDGPVISYAEAARRAEAKLARYAKFLASSAPAATTQGNVPDSGSKTGGSPAGKPAAPTLDRPLGYWQNPDRESQREAAIREALAEAGRVTVLHK